MGRICILTDNTAQFPSAAFQGYKLVSVIPLHIQLDGKFFLGGEGVRVHDLSVSANTALSPSLIPPSVEEFCHLYHQLGKFYDEIVVILISSHLNLAFKNGQKAAEIVQGSINIHVIDSQTTAVGLGILVQIASQAASEGVNGTDIKRMICGLIPRVYTMFCISGLTYLVNAGILGPAQAMIGEMLNVMPLFVMEGGRLVPVQKTRSSRHLIDSLHEFINEFGDLSHIAILQGVPPFYQEIRSLRERINEDFPYTPLSEHTISSSLAVLFGPRSLGLFAMED